MDTQSGTKPFNSTEDQQTTATNPSHLLRLPDEVLLNMTNLLGSKDLCRLAQANKRLGAVAQDTIYREITLPQNTVVGLLNVLRESTTLAEMTTTLDVSWRNHPVARLNSMFIPGGLEQLESWALAVDSRQNNNFFETLMGTSVREFYTSVWSNPSFERILILVIGMLPKLKKLTVKFPPRGYRALPISHDRLLPLFHGIGEQLLQQRLEELNIRISSPMSLSMENVTLRNLVNLRRLSIPMDALTFQSHGSLVAKAVLPPNLELLQIKPCNQHIIVWIGQFTINWLDGEFKKLKTTELFFDQPCFRSGLLSAAQGDDSDLNFLRSMVGILRRFSLTLEAHTRNKAKPGRLREELDAWYHMSDSERWMASTREMEFSEAVAKNDAGEPRFRTKAEIRAFLVDIKSNLSFSSPNDESNGRDIYHFGVQGWGKKTPKYELSASLSDAATNWIIEQGDRSAESIAFLTFDPSRFTSGQGSHLTFNAEKWLSVDFFALGDKKTQPIKFKPETSASSPHTSSQQTDRHPTKVRRC
ncbi:unnamed protein product [Periconia digitata]|uniref:F-box domain-containing protein n=1 Tax=Periconia digitata TaxID=1303443 RepID=A0A9W4USK1_9PLEO|nr:unnamed protein product [Periconia digitata]